MTALPLIFNLRCQTRPIPDDVTDSFGPSADGSVPLTIEDMIMAENFDQYLMSTDCINWHRDY
jgi:hypothetical protein